MFVAMMQEWSKSAVVVLH